MEIGSTEFHGLKLLAHCGGGAFGDVYYCRDISGQKMAVKIVSKKKLGDSWSRELKGVINYRKSRDYMTAKDTSSWFKRFGMIILRSFVGYLVLAIVLIWAMEIQGVTMRNLLYAFIAWELTLFMPGGYPCRAPNILLCSLNKNAQSLSNSMS